MAVAFRAVGAFAHSVNAITPAMPAGTLQNDILLLCLQTANQAITVSGGTETWVEVTNSPQGTATDATRLTMFWARASQDTPTSPTTSDSGNHQGGIILGFSGCITTGNPWSITSGGTAGSTTSPSVTGATTTDANCLVAIVIGESDSTQSISGWTNADLGSITEVFDTASATGTGTWFGVATGTKAVAGAYGNTTATTVDTIAPAFMTVALKPPAAATGNSNFFAFF